MGEVVKGRLISNNVAIGSSVGGSLAQRAYSPTVEMTETEDGVRIEMTDVNGTQEVTVYNGQDYVLTEEDKEEIADIAKDSMDYDDVPTDASDNLMTSGAIKEALDLKADKTELPVNVSELNNDAGYLTQHQDISGKQDTLTFDNTPKAFSSNPVTSAGVYDAIRVVKNDVTALQGDMLNAQIDIGMKLNKNDVDFALSSVSENPVQNKVLKSALDLKADKTEVPKKVSDLTNDAGYLTQHQDISGKQDVLTFDDVPQIISNNPVKSSGIWSAINSAKIDVQGNVDILQTQVNSHAKDILDLKFGKQNNLTFDSAPTENSTNPVTSGGVYSAIANVNTMDVHICANEEYDAQTGVPTISSPDAKTFYLVPGGEAGNLYIEWVYVNNAWEQFGSATVDLSGYALKSELPQNVSDLVNDAGYLTTHQDISGKQDVLTFDNTPTANSNNPVKSNGIKAAIDTVAGSIPTKVSDLTDDSGHYTKPVSGIPASDLASGIIPTIIANSTAQEKASIRTAIGAENGDDIVKVQDTQPSSSATKIWIPETMPEGIEVPTVDEVEDMIDDAIQENIGDISAITADVATIQSAASDAEAYTQGTRNGTAVGSSDPAYHNNAKYYSEQAFSGTPEGYADLVDNVDDLKSAMYSDVRAMLNGQRNMFDYTDAGVTRYQYIDADGTIHTGTSSTFGNYYTSHLITVSRGTYKFTAYAAAFVGSAGTVGVFDEDGNLTETLTATVENDVATLTVAKGCRIRFNSHKNIIAQAVFCEAGLWDGAYHPFEKSIKNELLDLDVGKEETDFFLKTRGTNLLDLRDGVAGKYFEAKTGTKNTGTLSSYSDSTAYYVRLNGAGTYVTEVAKGVYVETNAKYLALYDRNKRYLMTIEGTVASTSDIYEAPCTFTITEEHIAAGAVYLGLTVYNSRAGSVMVVKGDTYPAAYIPYSEKWTVPDLTVEPSQFGDMTGVIGKKDTDFVVNRKSANLLDLSDPVEDKYFNVSNGNLSSISSSYQVESVYVKLDGAGTYVTKADYNLYGSNAAKVCLFNAGKTYVTTVTGTLGSTSDVYGVPLSFEVTDAMIEAGAVYAGLTLYKPYAGTLMFVKDDEYPETYEPYSDEWIIPDVTLKAGQAPAYTPNPLYGKKAVFDGDSICASSTDTSGKGAYAGRIAAANSMGLANYAVGGGTITAGIDGHYCISGNVDTIYAAHPDADYVIFEGGTNDADLIGRIVDSDNQPITPPAQFGTFSPNDFGGTYDSGTFCGAVETMLYKALAHWPHAKIGYVCGPKMRETRASNTTMLNRMAYWKTAIEICKKWGVPYINLCEKWHANPLITMYYDPEMTTAENREAGHFYGDGQHPTPTGYDDMAPIIEEWMRTL